MSSDGTENSGKLWGIAAIVGVLAFLVLKFLVGYTFWPALILAILIGILVAILLWIGFYRDAEADDLKPGSDAGSTTPATGSSAQASNLSGEVKSAPVAKPAAVKARPKARAKPAAAKARPKAPAKPAAKAKPKAKPRAAAKKPAAKSKSTGGAGKSTATSMMGAAGSAMVSEKKAAQAKGSAKPVAKDGKPPLLKKARAAGADDLKLIKGVGPGLEKTLNELGFYHYDQVAAWRKKEIDWVDERLKFKGRIVRDDWIKQCKTLARGGSTEFSKRTKKGGAK